MTIFWLWLYIIRLLIQKEKKNKGHCWCFDYEWLLFSMAFILHTKFMLLLFCFHLRIRPSSYFRFSFDVDLDQQNHIDDDDDRPTLFIQFNSSKVQETNRFVWWWWWWRFRTIGHILLAYNPIDTTRPWKALVNSSVQCIVCSSTQTIAMISMAHWMACGHQLIVSRFYYRSLYAIYSMVYHHSYQRFIIYHHRWLTHFVVGFFDVIH